MKWLVVLRYYLGLKDIPSTSLRGLQETLHELRSTKLAVKLVLAMRYNLKKVSETVAFCLGFAPFTLALAFDGFINKGSNIYLNVNPHE